MLTAVHILHPSIFAYNKRQPFLDLNNQECITKCNITNINIKYNIQKHKAQGHGLPEDNLLLTFGPRVFAEEMLCSTRAV